MSKDLRNTLIAIALFVAVAGVLVYFVTDTQNQIDEFVQKNQALEDEIAANRKVIEEGPKLKQQLDELNANFANYVKILPSAEIATPEKLMKLVQSFADASQIHLNEVIQRDMKGGGGGKMGEFTEVAVTFSIDADFDSFVRFLNLLERHEQFLKVNAFTVTPGPPRVVENKEVIPLGVTIEVTTYRYIPKK